MMNNKSSAAVLLAILLLLTAAVVGSCGKSSVSTDKSNSDKAPNEESPYSEEESALPEKLRFDGESFNIYLAFPSLEGSYISEGENGDIINDAVFKRNALVEQRLGIKLNVVSTANGSGGSDQSAQCDKIASLVLAGDKTYDMFVHVQHSGMPGLITEGLFLDWNTIPYLSLDKPWWYENALRDISFGNKIFAMTGDYNLSSLSNTGCLAFNKDIIDELEMEYPYGLVFDGSWTHDKFVEYIIAGTKDLNGDGLLKWEDDRIGLSGWGYGMSQAVYVGYGGETLKKDENNLPVLNIYSEKQNIIIDKLIEVFSLPGTMDLTQYEVNVDEKVFAEGRLLFNDCFLNNITYMRNYDFEFGFVPYPKLNKEQDGYRCRTSNISGLSYIPITNERLEITGAVLEAMAYYSYKEVIPKFFDTVLKVQSTRDIESEKMIPIIKESARFMDQAIGFTPNMFSESLQNTLASHWASNRTSYETKLATLKSAYCD